MQRALATAAEYDVYLGRAAAALATLCALSVFLYGTFLLMAVAHTAARTDAQKQIVEVSSHLSELEMQYLSITRTLTPERAQSLGFVAPTTVVTVFTAPTATALGYNQQGSALSIKANE